MKILTSLSLVGLTFLSTSTLFAQQQSPEGADEQIHISNCSDESREQLLEPISNLPSSISYLGITPKLMMNPSSLKTGEQAVGKSVGVFRTSATETERTIAAARTTGGGVTSVRSGQGNAAAASSDYSAVAGGFRGEVEADDDVDAEESHSTNKYLKKLIQDNIYEECLAEVAKLSLTKRQTASGRLTLAQEEQEEWNVAKAAANSSKRKAERELKTAQRETLEASATVEDIKRNARDAVRAPQQGSEEGQALAAATILYEKARAAYAASELEVKRRVEILAEARLAVADAVLDAIDFHNTAQKTIVEAALDEAKETEEEAARAVETAKADVALKDARLRPAEQNFNTAKRIADQAPKQSPQKNNDVLQAAAKAAKLEVSLSEARALLARKETAWTSAQETLRKADVNAKEKAAKDAEREAIARSTVAQKVAELSEALRDVNLAEADFSAAAKVAARDVLYATTVAKDVTAAAGASARAKAEREAADNKKIDDRRVVKERLEVAFNQAVTINTEASWLAVKNIAGNINRDDKSISEDYRDFFSKKEKIADNKITFLKVKNYFIPFVQAAQSSVANIMNDNYYSKSYDDVYKRNWYTYNLWKVVTDSEQALDNFLKDPQKKKDTYFWDQSYGYMFNRDATTIIEAIQSAQGVIYHTTSDLKNALRTRYGEKKRIENKNFNLVRNNSLLIKSNIEKLESLSTRTVGTIWEGEVQWLLRSAKEVINEAQAVIDKAITDQGDCNIM